MTAGAAQQFARQFDIQRPAHEGHGQVIDLKGRGTAPLTDLIRVHALACGSKAQNSLERLDAIAATKLLTEEAITQLRYALEFLSLVRVRHQAMAAAEQVLSSAGIPVETFACRGLAHGIDQDGLRLGVGFLKHVLSV